MTNNKHTPTPWAIEKYCVWAGDKYVAATQTGINEEEQQANATFIVKACNNYETLLTAAKKALEFMERVEATEWDDGGAETIPDVEEFRQIMSSIEE